MDDKELIKKIMEEVKDEKLREELLALVAEKNRRQSEAKQEEKPINHKTRHGILSKIGWGIWVIMVMVGFFFYFLAFGPLPALAVVIIAALGIIIGLLKEIKETLKK